MFSIFSSVPSSRMCHSSVSRSGVIRLSMISTRMGLSSSGWYSPFSSVMLMSNAASVIHSSGVPPCGAAFRAFSRLLCGSRGNTYPAKRSVTSSAVTSAFMGTRPFSVIVCSSVFPSGFVLSVRRRRPVSLITAICSASGFTIQPSAVFSPVTASACPSFTRYRETLSIDSAAASFFSSARIRKVSSGS